MNSQHTGKFQFGFWIGRRDHNGVIQLRQSNGDRRMVKEGDITEMRVYQGWNEKFTQEDGPILCNQGMHACFTPYNCLRYHRSAVCGELVMFFVAVTGRIHYGSGFDSHKFCGDYRTHLVDLGVVSDIFNTPSFHWNNSPPVLAETARNHFDRRFFKVLNERDPDTLPAIVDLLKEEGSKRDLRDMRKYRSAFVPKQR